MLYNIRYYTLILSDSIILCIVLQSLCYRLQGSMSRRVLSFAGMVHLPCAAGQLLVGTMINMGSC